MQLIVISCLFAVALAAPHPQQDAVIIHDERVDNGDGNFKYSFAADNGIEMEVVGTPGAEGESNMQGFYLLPLADGGFARIDFVANENGFQAVGDILPTPHPLPAHVIEQLRIAGEPRLTGITFESDIL